VVLHPGDEHFVAGFQIRAPPALSDEIDAFRTALGEHDLASIGGVDEARHGGPSCLVGARRTLAQQVCRPVNVRVVVTIVGLKGVENLPRLLRRIGVVEIDERLAVNQLAEDREILADFLHIERGGLFGKFRHRH
jgi:hypothetical protein